MDPERKVNTKKLTKSEIKDLLVKYGLETKGNKDVLETRLKEYYESQGMEEEDDAQDDYLSVQDEIKPDDSVSNQGSAVSSVRSKRAMNAARLRGLQVKMQAMKQEQQLKQQLLEQERERERLCAKLEHVKLASEMEAIQAEDEALAEYDEIKSSSKSQSPTNNKGYTPPIGIGEFLQTAAKEYASNGGNETTEFQLSDDLMIENTSPQQTSTKQASTAAPTNPVVEASLGTKSACQIAVKNTAPEDRDRQVSYADVNNRLKTSSTKQATNETATIQPDMQVLNPSLLLQQQMLDLMTLPKPQLITFDGDPLNFHVFLNTFDSWCIIQT